MITLLNTIYYYIIHVTNIDENTTNIFFKLLFFRWHEVKALAL
jgi:hypothetical protein